MARSANRVDVQLKAPRSAARAGNHVVLHARRPRALDQGNRRADAPHPRRRPSLPDGRRRCPDTAFAPGTGTPEPGGMTSLDLLHACRELGRRLELVGMDVVEVIPTGIGSADVTALVADRIVREALTSLALRRKANEMPRATRFRDRSRSRRGSSPVSACPRRALPVLERGRSHGSGARSGT
jgi:hypothetical protein